MMIVAAQDTSFVPYAGAAVFLVGLALAAHRWMGRTVKKDLDPAHSGRMRASMAVKADLVPPALVKEALAKGLVSSAQLATMSPIERQFLFAQLRPKLTGSAPSAEPPPLSNTHLPLKPQENAAPHNAPQLRSTQAIAIVPGKPMSLPPLTPEQLAALGPPAAARPASPGPAANAPVSDAFGEDAPLRVFCPYCGFQLVLPAFQPFVAFCDKCGAKTAVRTEQQGRMMINTAPPGVTRRPVG